MSATPKLSKPFDPFPKRKDLVPVTIEFPPEVYRELERVVADEKSTLESATIWAVELMLNQIRQREAYDANERD
jgi:hypothetical protein